MDRLRTSQVAGLAGVNLQTIRFYEREGLLPKPPRTAGGYRAFSADTVKRIKFIKRAQALGFTLPEIKELLAMRVDPDTSCAEVKRRAKEKVADIEAKIQALQRMRLAMVRLIAACGGRGDSNECPILEALNHEDNADDPG